MGNNVTFFGKLGQNFGKPSHTFGKPGHNFMKLGRNFGKPGYIFRSPAVTLFLNFWSFPCTFCRHGLQQGECGHCGGLPNQLQSCPLMLLLPSNRQLLFQSCIVILPKQRPSAAVERASLRCQHQPRIFNYKCHHHLRINPCAVLLLAASPAQ